MLSSRAKYGLHAVLILAERFGEGPILISEISDAGEIPKKFLEHILLQLKRQGILVSRKGRGGGYELRCSPDQITMGQIIRILDGPLALTPCTSLTAYMKCEECMDERTCGIRLVMKDVREAVADILDNTSITDVMNRVRKMIQCPDKT